AVVDNFRAWRSVRIDCEDHRLPGVRLEPPRRLCIAVESKLWLQTASNRIAELGWPREQCGVAIVCRLESLRLIPVCEDPSAEHSGVSGQLHSIRDLCAAGSRCCGDIVFDNQ